MNELALFAGAGGGILGGKLLGWTTVCAVERDAYAAGILVKRQNDGFLKPFPIWSDVCTFDGKSWRGIVDVVSGGFPCQDISSAGKGAGIEGERSGMWKEMARIIGEVRPQYAFVENSPMLTSRGLGTVLRDLASMGFDAEWGVLSAADVGANHQRERIWILGRNTERKLADTDLLGRNDRQVEINSTKAKLNAQRQSGASRSDVAYTNSEYGQRRTEPQQPTSSGRKSRNKSTWCSDEVCNTSSIRQQGQGESIQPVCTEAYGDWKANILKSIGERDQWEVEPNLGRVANGVAFSMDRLKSLGNGQVPLCAATAFNLLRERFD
jgi:DNA (cytosine-5)-methyltransferase 1